MDMSEHFRILLDQVVFEACRWLFKPSEAQRNHFQMINLPNVKLHAKSIEPRLKKQYTTLNNTVQQIFKANQHDLKTHQIQNFPFSSVYFVLGYFQFLRCYDSSDNIFCSSSSFLFCDFLQWVVIIHGASPPILSHL